MWVLTGGCAGTHSRDNDDNNISDTHTSIHTKSPPPPLHAKASDGRLYTVQEAFGLPSSSSSSSSSASREGEGEEEQEEEEEGEDDCIICLTERKVWMDGWMGGSHLKKKENKI